MIPKIVLAHTHTKKKHNKSITLLILIVTIPDIRSESLSYIYILHIFQSAKTQEIVPENTKGSNE